MNKEKLIIFSLGSVFIKNNSTLLSILIGTTGGFIFNYLSMPLPWMLGSMAATIIAASVGINITIPNFLRNSMIGIIGVRLGGAFYPGILEQVVKWSLSILTLTIFIFILTFIISTILRKLKYDFATAFFSSLPAGLTEMTIVGEKYGGKSEIIAITHTVRIITIAFAIPLVFFVLLDYERLSLTSDQFIDYKLTDLAILMSCWIIGIWLNKFFKIPAGMLAWPLAFSAFVHITSITNADVPNILLSASQVILGASVGAKISIIKFATAKKSLAIALVLSVGSLLFSWLSAIVLGTILDIDPLILILALTPGGVTEMSLIAISIDKEVAFVTTHHILRISLLVTLGPIIFLKLKKIFYTTNSNTTNKNLE